MIAYLFFCVVLLTQNWVSTADCSSYCSKPAKPGECCQRFELNVDPNSDILLTASSSYNSKHGPDRAALFEVDTSSEVTGGTAGWVAATSDQNQWIQVDFGFPRHVTGILMQGRGGYEYWVTSFRVLFSDDQQVFYSTEVIEGTFDPDTVARRFFDRPIRARYFRINPVTWNRQVTLRFDLLGCNI